MIAGTAVKGDPMRKCEAIAPNVVTVSPTAAHDAIGFTKTPIEQTS
jgi:hypothetical protein